MGQQSSILVSEEEIIEETITENNKVTKNDLNIDDLFNLFVINMDIPDHRDYYYKLDKILDDDIIKPNINLSTILAEIEKEYMINDNHMLYLLKLKLLYLLKLQGEDIIIPNLNYINYHTILLEYNNNNYINQSSTRVSIRNILKSINKNGIDKNNDYYHIEYFRIHNNIEELKYHLSQNKILLCNISLFTSFLKSKSLKEGILDFPDDYDSILGLSLSLIIGYNEDDSFIIKLNDTKYGKNGIFIITKQYLNLIKDIWLFHIIIDKKKKYGINQKKTLNNPMIYLNDDIINNNINHNKNRINKKEIKDINYTNKNNNLNDKEDIEDVNYRRFIY